MDGVLEKDPSPELQADEEDRSTKKSEKQNSGVDRRGEYLLRNTTELE